MAVKVSTLLRHLKKLKLVEQTQVHLLMPDGSVYRFGSFGQFHRACCDVFNGNPKTEAMRAVSMAKASRNGGKLLDLLRMLDDNDEQLCD